MSATLISPTGERHEVTCMRAFAREHGLDSGNLARVIHGERQHHKGWRSVEPPVGFERRPWGLARYTEERHA
jgi:hypothetical protein